MTNKTLKIPVMEIFGPTIQGEGRVIGQKTMFLRTGGCDYSCSWCDSKFTWDGSQKATMMTPEEVLNEIMFVGGGTNFNHVTISGGNPALIGEAMSDFIQLCAYHNIETSLETQGSRWQDWFLDIDQLCLSPKPPSSGMATDFDKLHDIIAKIVTRNMAADEAAVKNMECSPSPYNYPYLKVVVFDDEDFLFAKKVHQLHPTLDMFVSVGNSTPYSHDNLVSNFTRLMSQYEWLINKVLEDPEMNNVRPLPQLHTLVWGNKRGV